MYIPRIPPEVTDLIIDEIDQFNVSTLKACSLTCRSFRPTAQKRIFHTVHLRGKESLYQSFYNAISSSPALADHVRVLKIVGINKKSSKNPALSQIFSMLCRVREISLGFGDFVRGSGTAWNDLDAALQQALKDAILRPEVERLVITGPLILPNEAAKWLCAIARVCLIWVTFEDSVDNPPTALVTDYPFRIKYLEVVHKDYSNIRPLISTLDSSQSALQKLVAKLYDAADLDVAQELIFASPSLTSLDLPSSPDRKGISSPVSLGTLNNLTALQIETSNIDDARIMLETLPSTTTLQTLTLKVKIVDLPYWISRDSESSLYDLDVLLSREKFKALKKVVVLVKSFPVESLYDNYREAFQRRLREVFGGLCRNGMLCVESQDIRREWDSLRDDIIQFL